MKLSQLNVGASCFVVSVDGKTELRRHMYDMGITPNTRITAVRRAPFGDPIIIRLRGYELTVRRNEADLINVRGE